MRIFRKYCTPILLLAGCSGDAGAPTNGQTFAVAGNDAPSTSTVPTQAGSDVGQGGGTSTTSERPTAPASPSTPTGSSTTPKACVSLVPAQIETAYDDGSNDGHGPQNVLDGDLAEESRWSSQGIGKWVVLDLAQERSVGEVFTAWLDGDTRDAFYDVEASQDASSWVPIATGRSSKGSAALEAAAVTTTVARYIRIIGRGNSNNDWNSLLEVEVHECVSGEPPLSEPSPDPSLAEPIQPGPAAQPEPAQPEPEPGAVPSPNSLNPQLPPSGNLDFGNWNLSIPTDDDNTGTSDTVSVADMVGFENQDYFFTAEDGGVTFRCTNAGYRTSKNTSFTRSELREMLRGTNQRISTKGVNKNNWVLSTAPASDRNAAGGVDGTLRARLAVDHVTTTGDAGHVGRVIIGQIHANDDEPVRLYYRKLPNNERGSIYFAHEPRNGFGDEEWIDVIGSRSNSASNPADGIALGEVFGYEIDMSGNTLTITITTPSGEEVRKRHDMSGSGFDRGGQYLYFKAGVYNQNNSGRDNDFVQATFYELSASH